MLQDYKKTFLYIDRFKLNLDDLNYFLTYLKKNLKK